MDIYCNCQKELKDIYPCCQHDMMMMMIYVQQILQTEECIAGFRGRSWANFLRRKDTFPLKIRVPSSDS